MDDDRLQKRTDELKKSAADGGYALSADEELVRGLAAGSAEKRRPVRDGDVPVPPI